jgi:hypothetical protein
MEFTIHNSYTNLELVPSTVICWTGPSCWWESYSNKATLPSSWNHCYKMIRSSSQCGWPLRNIHISNSNGSFIFYADGSFLYHCQYFCRTCLYIWVTRRVSNKKQKLLTIREHMSSFPVFVRSVLLILLVFCVFTFWLRVLMSVTISAYKRVRFVIFSSVL